MEMAILKRIKLPDFKTLSLLQLRTLYYVDYLSDSTQGKFPKKNQFLMNVVLLGGKVKDQLFSGDLLAPRQI